ncbi:MAG: YkgJ family cysteine cluster protein [Spirochaetes bacterium]|nr:YkgJ family cysteine cluster protein [Spirochaetota bacterium]
MFLSKNDLLALSSFLEISKDDFLKKYCKIVNLGVARRISLIEKKNSDCIFWDNGGCTIYEHRPLQCKVYPFWSSALGSPENWEALGYNCPGVNQGKLYAAEEIEEKLALRRLDPLLEPE